MPRPRAAPPATCQARDVRLLGASNARLPRLAGVCVEVLGRGTDLVEEGVGRRMAGLLHSLGPSLPPGLVEAAYGGLSEAQQAAFSAYMSGAGAP